MNKIDPEELEDLVEGLVKQCKYLTPSNITELIDKVDEYVKETKTPDLAIRTIKTYIRNIVTGHEWMEKLPSEIVHPTGSLLDSYSEKIENIDNKSVNNKKSVTVRLLDFINWQNGMLKKKSKLTKKRSTIKPKEDDGDSEGYTAGSNDAVTSPGKRKSEESSDDVPPSKVANTQS